MVSQSFCYNVRGHIKKFVVNEITTIFCNLKWDYVKELPSIVK